MSCILNIETSTDVCSVCVSDNGECLFNKEDHDGPNHAVRLGSFVDTALAYVERTERHIDGVAVSAGPGSYTGLRIGASMAKGVCYGLDVPLMAVPTLEVLCVPVLLGNDDMEDDAALCPMIDARRMEVYAAVYDRRLNVFRTVDADVVTNDTYAATLDERHVYFFGSGAAKCKNVITHPHARFIDGVKPLARFMFPLAEKRLAAGQTEDTAYFEPFYLKKFMAKKSKKLI